MSIRGLIPFTKSYFGGAWTAPDPASVDGRGALTASDVQFFEKQVATRYGWAQAFSDTSPGVNSGVAGMYNWLSSIGNYIVWGDASFPPFHLYIAKVSDSPPTISQLTSVINGGNPVWASVGPRLYTTRWFVLAPNVNLLIPYPVHVITFDGTNFHFDQIIPGPPTSSLITSGGGNAPSETASGVVTAGLHNLGVRMLHRSGFLGRPGPDTSTSTNPTPLTFSPVQFTSSGAKNIVWNFTPSSNWPNDVIQVQLVMSPVNNPNRYFLVPGQFQAVTGGAATPVSFTVNIDDGSLVSGAAANECTNSLDFYTASATGQAYIQCTSVANIGTRMFYVSSLPDNNGNSYSVAFASDLGFPQQISQDQHVLQLPNQLQISTVFSVLGSIFLSGPHWTYFTQDTGDVPVNWPQPKLVDGRKGAAFPNCVEVSTSSQYAWVADKTGLYLFTGSFSELPISYNTKEWPNVGSSLMGGAGFSIKDDPLRHRVIVRGVIGRQTVYDYTNGMDPYNVRPYFWSDPIGGLNFGCFSTELVQNDLVSSPTAFAKTPEVWVGGLSPFNGKVYFFREKNPLFDTGIYRDNSAPGDTAIHAIYEPPILPEPGGSPNILAHQAMVPRIVGSGTITPTLYSFDKQVSKSFPSITLSASPDGRNLQRCYLKSNGFIYHFEQNVLDGFFILSDYTSYYSHYAGHR